MEVRLAVTHWSSELRGRAIQSKYSSLAGREVR